MNIIILTLALSFTLLTGCVEFKDANEVKNTAPQTVPIEVHRVSDLVVDEPLFLFQGKIVSEPEFDVALKHQKESEAPERADYTFENLTFKTGGVLYTNGAMIRIYAKNLIVEGGELSTFRAEAVAAPETAGRSGGQVLLKAQSAEGVLRVTMRGENGGRGAPGKAPDDTLTGGGGLSVNDMLSCKMNPRKKSGDCIFEGQPGLKGYDGGQGLPGGHSGIFQVEIEEPTEFQIREFKVFGLGGEGGAPGAGGAGGWDGAHIASAAQGPNGKKGDNGPNGSLERICTLINNKSQCF